MDGWSSKGPVASSGDGAEQRAIGATDDGVSARPVRSRAPHRHEARVPATQRCGLKLVVVDPTSLVPLRSIVEVAVNSGGAIPKPLVAVATPINGVIYGRATGLFINRRPVTF